MTSVPSPSLSGLRPMLLPASLLTALMAVLLAVPAMGAVPRPRRPEDRRHCPDPPAPSPSAPGPRSIGAFWFRATASAHPSSCVPKTARPVPAGPGAGLQGPRHRIHRVVRRWRPRHHGNRLRHDHSPSAPSPGRSSRNGPPWTANGWPIPRETAGNPFATPDPDPE